MNPTWLAGGIFLLTYTLIVTSTSTYTGKTTVYTYSIEIITGQETYFLFFPTS